eukprot:TRINITY_DN18700_c0_g1_i2.p4 TRINITY_DN18700_c0_g1~~TRINITY_DN18700_c0_g1_i2.p4  ORF type:complete len:143 (+),score=14.46 TRINITY_DN18700_c0_g1_i2:774-1202(+)
MGHIRLLPSPNGWMRLKWNMARTASCTSSHRRSVARHSHRRNAATKNGTSHGMAAGLDWERIIATVILHNAGLPPFLVFVQPSEYLDFVRLSDRAFQGGEAEVHGYRKCMAHLYRTSLVNFQAALEGKLPVPPLPVDFVKKA